MNDRVCKLCSAEGVQLLTCSRCTLPVEMIEELTREELEKFYAERMNTDDEYDTEIGWQYE